MVENEDGKIDIGKKMDDCRDDVQPESRESEDIIQIELVNGEKKNEKTENSEFSEKTDGNQIDEREEDKKEEIEKDKRDVIEEKNEDEKKESEVQKSEVEDKKDVLELEEEKRDKPEIEDKKDVLEVIEDKIDDKDDKLEGSNWTSKGEFENFVNSFNLFMKEVDFRNKEINNQMEKINGDLEKLRSEIESLGLVSLGLGDYIKREDFERVVGDLKSSFDKLAEENALLRQLVDNKIDTSKLLRIREEQERLSSKIDEILEEIGYGEEMNVGKIPPNILEIVYQTTLDDVISELWKNLGPYEGERVIGKVLEEVRLNTSGSELFKYDGKRLRAKYVSRTIEQKLISAKQVHITYNEILNKLLEHIPGHKAKNFNAMIKIKSQEYAVDKVSVLLEKVSMLEKRMEDCQNMSRAMRDEISKEFKKIFEDYREEIELKIKDRMEGIDKKANTNEILELKRGLEVANKAQEELKKELMILREEISKIKDKKEDKNEEKEESVCLDGQVGSNELKKEVVSEIPSDITDMGNKENNREVKEVKAFCGTVVICDEPEDKKVEEFLPEGLEEGSDDERVYSAIQKKGSSIPKILKKISYELSEDAVERILATLEERGFVKSVMKGKSRLYFKSKDYNEREDEV